MPNKTAALLASLFILLIPAPARCETGTFDIRVIDMRETGSDEYLLDFVQLSEPFGYQHKEDHEHKVRLRFQCPVYECTEDGNLPTLKDYRDAIELLKQQIAASRTIRISVAGRGFAPVEGTKDEFQSNGLYVRDGVVCLDYDFFDF